MAGDYIVWVKGLSSRVEVLRMAAALGLDRRVVACMCMEFWEWAEGETKDGSLPGFDVTLLSRATRDIPAAFFEALRDVGWLLLAADGAAIPHYTHWMGENAKKRLQARLRQRRHRSKLPDGRTPVTRSSRGARDKNVTTETDTETLQKGMNPLVPLLPGAGASPPSGPPGPPPVLSYPTSGKAREWHLSGAQVAEWSALFPGADVLGECRKALAWVQANPARRKTARGMPRFLVSWLGRAQDRGGAKAPAAPAAAETLREKIERIRREQGGESA